MVSTEHADRRGSVPAWIGPAAVAVVLAFSGLDWLGWAAGVDALTRVLPSWPQMTPWSAALLAALGVAILVQMGSPSTARVRIGFGIATVAGVLAVVFLAEYATGYSFGLDTWWFPDAVSRLQATWPGRPSPHTALTVLLLSIGVGLTRVDRRWARVAWALTLGGALVVPTVSAAAYLFDVISLVGVTQSTGMGISTALGLLTLVAATVVTRTDRNPLAWLLARPDRTALFRFGVILAGLPILLGSSRLGFASLGVGANAALVMAVLLSTVVFGAANFYVSQREQRFLIEKERASRERAEAEARYHILADNLVDVVVLLNAATIVHLNGTQVAWVSPSAQTTFGEPPEQWIGSDFNQRIHPDDIDQLKAALEQIGLSGSVVTRFRVSTANGSYHWVDGHFKPYVKAAGNTDGVIVALRLVDELVAGEQQLQRLARFDTLTGLVNRGEAIKRLNSALENRRSPGPHLGLLFCDIDHFKTVNDTWGHAAGDAVLRTIADRIRDCLREGDTVGRTGGDEMLVLLAGMRSLDDVARVAEKIRCRAAEPISHEGRTIHATLSIGATIAVPGESSDTITARADAAMYRAKQAGRNTVTRISVPDQSNKVKT